MCQPAQHKSDYYQQRNNPLMSWASGKVRARVHKLFFDRFGVKGKILDFGVTQEMSSPDSNPLERMHPDKSRITAVGLEDGKHLEKIFPGLRFQQIEAGKALPFTDEEFDVGYSNAVIEHIMGDDERVRVLSELLRVCKNLFFTTPNKYFPVDPHTAMPFFHFYEPLFYFLLEKKIISKFYDRTNLQPLSRGDLIRHLERIPGISYEIIPVWMFGWPSHWVVIVKKFAKA